MSLWQHLWGRWRGVRALFTDASFTAISQIANIAAAILTQVLMARAVSVTEFGSFATAQVLVLFVESALVSRGAEAATQLLGQHWNADRPALKAIANQLLRYDVAISTSGYLIFCALAIAAAPLMGTEAWIAIALGAAIPFQINFGARHCLFLLNDKLRSQARFFIVLAAIQASLALAMIPLLGAIGFVICILGTAAAKNLMVHCWTHPLWRDVGATIASPRNSMISQTIQTSSMHSIARDLLRSGSSNADLLILALAGRPEMVALYRVAKTLAGAPTKVAAPLWLVLRPRLLVALRSQDNNRYCALVFRTAAMFALGSIIVILGSGLVGGAVLTNLYGPAFAVALPSLLVLLVGNSFFGAITGWLNFTLMISSRKSLGTILFLSQLALIVVGGLLFGNNSSVEMAIVVAGCSILISTIAWWGLITGRFLRGPSASA